MSSRYLLLFGLPRSGTTWLGKIFDSHPATLYRHEPDSVERINGLALLPDDAGTYSGDALRQYLNAVRNNRSLKVVGKPPLFPKRYSTTLDLYLYRLSCAVSRTVSQVGLRLPVVAAPRISGEDDILVWKSIESLGRLGVIMSILPNAHALHIVRHPCGYIASVESGERGNRFGDIAPASEDYGLYEMLLATQIGGAWGFSITDVRAMYPEERLAWRWAIFNDKAIEDTAHQSKVMSFAYERLCKSPLTVARELIQFSDLEWSDQVERFVNKSTSANESTYYGVFKDPRQSAWSWQEKLEQSRVDRIIALARKSRTWTELEYEAMSCG